MSSHAYYMAMFAIIVAFAMVFASLSGADAVGDSFSMGMVLGVVGLVLIAASIVVLTRQRHRAH